MRLALPTERKSCPNEQLECGNAHQAIVLANAAQVSLRFLGRATRVAPFEGERRGHDGREGLAFGLGEQRLGLVESPLTAPQLRE